MADEGNNLIRARWDGKNFQPVGRVSLDRVKGLDDGELLGLEVIRDRSMRSHGHAFAAIKDLWLNIPEVMQEMPYAKSPETFRKHALMASGYYEAQTVDCGSPEAAERVGAIMSKMAEAAHGYQITQINGQVVRCFTPKSQSVKAMGVPEFQKSKTDVLEWCRNAVGVQ